MNWNLNDLIKALQELKETHGGEVPVASFVKSGSTSVAAPYYANDDDGKFKIFVGPAIWG